MLPKRQGLKLFSGWRRSSCPVKPIFARTQPMFGRTNIHYVIISINSTPPPPLAHPRDVYISNKYTFYALLYMQPRTQYRISGKHGAAATFGKMNITFVHTTIASVLCLQYGYVLIPTRVMKLMKLKLAI